MPGALPMVQINKAEDIYETVVVKVNLDRKRSDHGAVIPQPCVSTTKHRLGYLGSSSKSIRKAKHFNSYTNSGLGLSVQRTTYTLTRECNGKSRGSLAALLSGLAASSSPGIVCTTTIPFGVAGSAERI